MPISLRLALICVVLCACESKKSPQSSEHYPSSSCGHDVVEYDGQDYERAPLTCGPSTASDAHYCNAAGDLCVPIGSCDRDGPGKGVPCELEIKFWKGGGIARGSLVATNQGAVWIDMGPDDAVGNYLHQGAYGQLSMIHAVTDEQGPLDHPRELCADPRTGMIAWRSDHEPSSIEFADSLGESVPTGLTLDETRAHSPLSEAMLWRLYDGAIWLWDPTHHAVRRIVTSQDDWQDEEIGIYDADKPSDMLVTDQAVYMIDDRLQLARLDLETRDLTVIPTGHLYERLLGVVGSDIMMTRTSGGKIVVDRLELESQHSVVVVRDASAVAFWDDYLYYGSAAADAILRLDLRNAEEPEFVTLTGKKGGADALAPISGGLFWMDGEDLVDKPFGPQDRTAKLHFLPVAEASTRGGSQRPLPPKSNAAASEDFLDRQAPPAQGQLEAACSPASVSIDDHAETSAIGACNVPLVCSDARCALPADCAMQGLEKTCLLNGVYAAELHESDRALYWFELPEDVDGVAVQLKRLAGKTGAEVVASSKDYLSPGVFSVDEESKRFAFRAGSNTWTGTLEGKSPLRRVQVQPVVAHAVDDLQLEVIGDDLWVRDEKTLQIVDLKSASSKPVLKNELWYDSLFVTADSIYRLKGNLEITDRKTQETKTITLQDSFVEIYGLLGQSLVLVGYPDVQQMRIVALDVSTEKVTTLYQGAELRVAASRNAIYALRGLEPERFALSTLNPSDGKASVLDALDLEVKRWDPDMSYNNHRDALHATSDGVLVRTDVQRWLFIPFH